MCRHSDAVYDLVKFSDWLQLETWCQSSDGQGGYYGQQEKTSSKLERHHDPHSATILHGSGNDSSIPNSETTTSHSPANMKGNLSKALGPYCGTDDHYLSQCATFRCFDKDQMIDWIKTNKRCCRCRRAHQAAECNLKKPCNKCQGKHLLILHAVNSREVKEGTCLVSSASETFYLDKPSDPTMCPP